MTAPTTDPVATAPVEVDLNDDALVAAALSARMERQQHLFPDEPAAEPQAAATPTETAPPAKADPSPDASAVPADSTTPAPNAEAPADPEVPDPFAVLAKDAAPLTYKQHGVAKTFDGILEIPGKGALIPADKLDAVRNFIARGESNAAEVPRLLQERQQYEALGGIPKFHEVMEKNAQLNAASLLILNTVFENPRQFVNDDGTPNTVALEMLKREAKVAAQEARFQSITERTTQQQTFTQQTQDAEVRQSAVPEYITRTHTDLHPDDRAFLERKANQYLFTATREQAAQFRVPEGTLMLANEGLDADVAYLKALRAQATTTQTAATAAVKAAEKAAAENARRNPPAPPPKPKTASVPRDRDTGQFKRLDPSEIFERSLRGDAIGTPTLTE